MSSSIISTETQDIPQITIMSAPTSPTKSYRENRDTGFPEPFDGTRNTTLPHPDADTSPNACISQDDISVDQALKRTRRSFLSKHRRTVSHGYISPTSEAIHSALALAAIDTIGLGSGGHGSALRIVSPTASSRWSPRDDMDSIGESSRDKTTPPSSPELSPRSTRRRSLMSKWIRK